MEIVLLLFLHKTKGFPIAEMFFFLLIFIFAHLIVIGFVGGDDDND